MALNLSDLLPPERVREIAEQYYRSVDAINAAAPEIVSAVLEMAAKRFDLLSINLLTIEGQCQAELAARDLRQMAKEITNAD